MGDEEGCDMWEVISRYAKSWLLLKVYDEERLAVPEQRMPARITLEGERSL